jgi:hypothetical protein
MYKRDFFQGPHFSLGWLLNKSNEKPLLEHRAQQRYHVGRNFCGKIPPLATVIICDAWPAMTSGFP